jgi:acetolactate synthase-1/3 small subunit
MKHSISVFVENKPGVLTRIAGLFARRGFNIDSLTVGPTEDERFSRMTIVVEGDEEILEQITKQLYKLIDVIKVMDVTGVPHINRELALIKVQSTSQSRSEIIQIVDIFRAKIVDIGEESLIIEITGDEDKVQAILNLLGKFGIKELVRTGKIVLPRGKKTS